MNKLLSFFLSFVLFFGVAQNLPGMEGEHKPSYPNYLLNGMHPGVWVCDNGELKILDSGYKKISTREKQDFKKAADFLFAFTKNDVLKKSPQELEQMIIRVHDLLVGQAEPHGYRDNGFMTIFTTKFDGDPNKYKAYVGQLPENISRLFTEREKYTTRLGELANVMKMASVLYLDEAQQKKLIETHDQVAQLFHQWWDSLSVQERKYIQDAGFDYPPHWNKIPQKMRRFAEKLHTHLHSQNTGVDELAEYAHRKLVKIHPFSEGNGRTARFFMNFIEFIFGKFPTIFLSDVEYKDAVKKSLAGDKAAFLNFLIAQQASLNSLQEKKWLDNPRFCGSCKAPAFLSCGKCKAVSYCSADCQKKDWSRHKLGCKKAS